MRSRGRRRRRRLGLGSGLGLGLRLGLGLGVGLRLANPNPNPSQRAAGVFRDGIQYGEVSAASFARCLEWVTPVAGEVFYDLGSGTGKAVLTAAALHPLAATCGIEIQPRLHEAALAARRAFEAIEGASLTLTLTLTLNPDPKP